jgi:hypothetical protein
MVNLFFYFFMLARRVGQRAAALHACRYSSARAESSAPHPHLYHVLGERMIILRSMDSEFVSSPVDALAIVRAVERRFGRVAEYRFHRVCPV